MSNAGVYAKRLSALPRALGILELHPQGLPLVELADELGADPNDLREVFLAYYLADLVELGDFALPVVEFFAPGLEDAADEDVPVDVQWVRVLAPDPERELGVDYLNASQLAALHEAGVDLLALEPANETLREALDAFAAALQPADQPSAAFWKAETAAELHRAAEHRLRVRISYSRQWSPGFSERVIEPYRVVRTRRGWEVDAGPPDAVAAVRTFLVSGIVDCAVTDETFDLPANLDELLAAQRHPSPVEVVVPQSARWAVERFAEATTVLDDDEDDVALQADLLPPVEARLGLMLLCCGPDAFVTAPQRLGRVGVDAAQRLLAHHAG